MIERLRKRAQFLFVRAGAKAVRPHVIVEARRRAETGPLGLGLTASKKVGNAVTRNRARRRLREAARQVLPLHGIAGVDYVLVARAATADADWGRLLDDVRSALISLAAALNAPADQGGRTRRAPTKRPPSGSD